MEDYLSSMYEFLESSLALYKPDMVIHIYNPRNWRWTQEAHNFRVILSYIGARG